MILDTIITILGWLSLVVLAFAGFFSLLAAKHLHQGPIGAHKEMRRSVFLLLAWGMIFLVISLLAKLIDSLASTQSIAYIHQILLFLGGIFFLAAFIKFWIASSKYHSLYFRDRIFFVGMFILILIASIYLAVKAITNDVSTIIEVINLELWASVFLLTFVVVPRVRAKVIDSSLRYVSSGVFVYLVAAWLGLYFSVSNVDSYFLLVPAVLTLISCGYYCLGFYVAKKNYKKELTENI